MQLTTRADRVARADDLVAELGERTWQRLSVGAGAHGPREYDWACRQIDGTWPRGRGHWLLARRMSPSATPLEIAYYLCYGPATARLVGPGLDRRHALACRRSISAGQRRSRTRPLPGPQLAGLVCAHHPVDARSGLAGSNQTVAAKGDPPTRSEA